MAQYIVFLLFKSLSRVHCNTAQLWHWREYYLLVAVATLPKN